MTPRFSIFIPVWNGAAWIGGAIESVLAQTYTEWELVIGDNASTDGVATVVGRYTDPRIRLHRWPTHTDLCENFNRTMLLCRSEWVQPLGVDDRLAAALPGNHGCAHAGGVRPTDAPERGHSSGASSRLSGAVGRRLVLWLPRARKDPERCARRCFLVALLADGRDPVEYWDGRLCP